MPGPGRRGRALRDGHPGGVARVLVSEPGSGDDEPDLAARGRPEQPGAAAPGDGAGERRGGADVSDGDRSAVLPQLAATGWSRAGRPGCGDGPDLVGLGERRGERGTLRSGYASFMAGCR